MFRLLKRTIGMWLMGLGFGILLVLLLPIKVWLFLIGAGILVVGIMWLFC